MRSGHSRHGAIIASALLLALVQHVHGWVLNGYRWASSNTTLHLQLSKEPTHFQDGSSSWNDPAAAAIDIWNSHLDGFQFIRGTSIGAAAPADGANQVFFSNTIYGDTWPRGVLAVTLNYSSSGSTFTETDVIFNNSVGWNSYRGRLQSDSRGNPIYDVRRVALHEFGHVLGLGHPDENGQSHVALMNSILGDLDNIGSDDIAGAHAIYGFRITSPTNPPAGRVGQEFIYRITANQPPSTYEASDLPPGLQVYPNTGIISGTPTAHGTYAVTVTATRPDRTASAVVQIRIEPPPPAPPPPPPDAALAQIFRLPVARLAVDPPRARIYASVPSAGTVVVIDTNSLEIVQTIEIGGQPHGLATSADGSKLWVANRSRPTQGIDVIDLQTLTILPRIALPCPASEVRQGIAGQLYVTCNDYTQLTQVNAATGAVTQYGVFDIGWDIGPSGLLEISDDRRTLFAAEGGTWSNKIVHTFDVSGPRPVRLQKRQFNRGYSRGLTLSHNGSWLIYVLSAGHESIDNFRHRSLILSASNFQGTVASFDAVHLNSSFGSAAFSGDDAVLYVATKDHRDHAAIRMYETRTFRSFGEFGLQPAYPPPAEVPLLVDPSDMIVDPSGAHIFVRASYFPGVTELRVYRTGRVNGPAVKNVPTSQRLGNLSTRLSAGNGEQSLIGGFIVTGHAEKKVVVRALGPSLPVADVVADPTLELRDSAGNLLAANDNWGTDRDAISATNLAPSDQAEAAIVRTLPPGSYTATVGSANGTPGVGLVEMYDLNPEANAGLVNISTRGSVGREAAVMIAGLIVRGSEPTRVVVRALGPSLVAAGVVDALSDTTLEVVDASGNSVASNDDWRGTDEQTLVATSLAPSDDREAAAVVNITPGNYTAIVRGKDNATGIGLVEVYNLEQN